MGEMSFLPNIGQELERQLKEVGIADYGRLKELGSKAAWLKIRAVDSSACINRLYALEGAIQGVRKSELTQESKAQLREFYNGVKEG